MPRSDSGWPVLWFGYALLAGRVGRGNEAGPARIWADGAGEARPVVAGDEVTGKLVDREEGGSAVHYRWGHHSCQQDGCSGLFSYGLRWGGKVQGTRNKREPFAIWANDDHQSCPSQAQPAGSSPVRKYLRPLSTCNYIHSVAKFQHL